MFLRDFQMMSKGKNQSHSNGEDVSPLFFLSSFFFFYFNHLFFIFSYTLYMRTRSQLLVSNYICYFNFSDCTGFFKFYFYLFWRISRPLATIIDLLHHIKCFFDGFWAKYFSPTRYHNFRNVNLLWLQLYLL